MKYQCSCTNKSEIRFDDFKNNVRCMKCSGNEKLTFEYVKAYFTEQNCELLETDYKNNSTKMKYKCKCDYISEIRFKDFKNGIRCLKCGA